MTLRSQQREVPWLRVPQALDHLKTTSEGS